MKPPRKGERVTFEGETGHIDHLSGANDNIAHATMSDGKPFTYIWRFSGDTPVTYNRYASYPDREGESCEK